MNRRIALIPIAFCTLAIAGAWTVALQRAQEERREAVESALDTHSSLAAAYAEVAGARLDALREILRSAAGAARRPGESLSLDQVVAERWPESSASLQVGVATERGVVSLATTGSGCLGSVTKLDAMSQEQLPVGQMQVGEAVLCRATGRWMIPLVLRAERGDAALAIAAVDAEHFAASFGQPGLGAGSVVALVGYDGIARVQWQSRRLTFGDDYRQTGLDTARERTPAGFVTGTAGAGKVPRYYSFRSLPRYAVMATVGRAEADVLAPPRRHRLDYFLMAFMTSVFAVAVAIRVASLAGFPGFRITGLGLPGSDKGEADEAIGARA